MTGPGSSRSPGRRWALALALIVVAATAGCRDRGATGASGSEGPFRGAPVVLISIDTLRSDHLPAYGYHEVDTPAIDGLRRDGILFARAYSHVPLTLPSHSSIFSGELPSVHGVRDNVGYRYDAKRFPTLAGELGGAGYATAGFVSAYVLREETGVGAGFATWDDDVRRRYQEVLGNSQRPGRETVAAALGWLAKVGDRPFFLFVHLYDPHSPYAPPEPFASRYQRPYDGEVAAADAAVGELLAGLRQRGLYDRAVVVLLSDHGEGLGEHGEQEHGVLLYRETLQVPLLLKLPGGRRAGSTVEQPVGLVDVFPTLLVLTGVQPRRTPSVAGRSLLDPTPTGRDLYAETYYPRLHFGWSELISILRDRDHYIHGPTPELFDVLADPSERHDVLRERRRVYAELRAVAAKSSTPLVGPGAEDAESRKELAALGYAGSTVAVAPGQKLPDPRQHIHDLAALFEGMMLVNKQSFVAAIPVLRGVVERNPLMVDGWEYLGGALRGAGRLDEALVAYQQALRASPGATHVAAEAGSVLLALGRPDEAKRHARLALESSPAIAHTLLARIALDDGDLDGAEREAKAALASGSDRVVPLIVRAEVEVKRGRVEEARRTVEEAEAEVRRQGSNERVPGLGQVRGDVLARLGQAAEAEAAFRAEIERFPASLRAYSGLALLFAAQGRPEEAVALLRRLVEANGGSPSAYAEAVRALRALGDRQDAATLLRHALSLHPDSRELHSLAG